MTSGDLRYGIADDLPFVLILVLIALAIWIV